MTDLRMPAIIAWLFFLPGVIFITVDIVRLNITGVFALGVVFLLLWAYLIGVFTKSFWVEDIDETHPESLNRRDRNAGITRKAQP